MTPTPALVELVRRELESVPCLHGHVACRVDTNYPALAEKVAGWIEPLREALLMAKETIRVWHGINSADEETEWELYQFSPEMKQIATALARFPQGPTVTR